MLTLCLGILVGIFMIKWLPRCFDHSDNDLNTVKPVLSGHSKIDKTKVLMANVSLMKVECIAECSTWSILQYF